MSIRYCIKCRSIFDENKSLFIDNLYYCINCKQVLIYFGREEAFISDPHILEAYDLLHPFDPKKDFKGVYKNYGTIDVDRSVLECEDILLNFPYDRKALFYLTKYYWNLKDHEKSWRYFSLLIEHYDLENEEAQFYVSYLLFKKQFKSLITFLLDNQESFDSFFVFHYLGVGYLAMAQYKNALLNFYRSLSFCDDTIREEKIISIIKKINSYIENN